MTAKLTKPTLLIFGLILLTIPLWIILTGAEELAFQDELARESEIRQALLTEQEDFLRDLDLARFLQTAQDELDLEDGLLSIREGTVRQVAPGHDPQFLTETFFRRRLGELRRRFALVPLYFFVTSTDNRQVWWQAKPPLAGKYSSAELEWLGRATAFNNTQSEDAWLVDSKPFMPMALALQTPHITPGQYHRVLVEKMFGQYWNKSTLRDDIVQGYSERLGSRLFLCSRFLLSRPNFPCHTFGGYGAFFLDATIPRSLVLHRALSRSRQAPLLKRSISWVSPAEPPGFISSGPTQLLRTSLPVEYRQGLIPPAPGLQPAMVVSSSRSPGDNPFQERLTPLKRASLLVFLFSSLAGLYWCSTNQRLSLSARWKLTGIISIVVFLPMAALGFMTFRLMSLFDRETPERVLKMTRNRVRSVASILEEQVKKGTIELQRVKEQTQTLAPTPSSDLNASLAAILSTHRLVNEAFLYRKDGASSINTQEQDSTLKDLLKACSQLLFEELGALSGPARERKEDLLRGEMFDFFWFVNRADIGFALENMESRSVMSFQEDQRMGFWILASDTQTPSSVWGICYLLLHTTRRCQAYLEYLASHNTRPLSTTHPLADIQLGIFQFTQTAGMKDGWPKTALFNRDMIEIIRNHGRSRNSGVIWSGSGETRSLHVWEQISDQFLLIVGQAKLRPQPTLVQFGALLAFSLLLASVTLNLLMADLLSSLLIGPIRTLAAAVTLIGQGSLETRVEIATDDELGEVGQAFNRMAAGVQQRERLKRFVPVPVIQRFVPDAESGDAISHQEGTSDVELIVLASDIRGFTSLTERMAPEQLVLALNDYFTLMQEAITSEGGRVLKLVGDAILAVFFPDTEGQAPVQAALRAARTMRVRLREFNRARQAAGLFQLENGIGLALGMALPVNLGMAKGRRDFTILGPPIAEASALESLTPRCQRSRIVVGDSLASRLGDRGAFLRVTPANETASRAFRGDTPHRKDAPDSADELFGWEVPEEAS